MTRKKTLFNDKPIEIQELVVVVKRDIQSLSAQLQQLKELIGGNQKPINEFEEHGRRVIWYLQNKLTTTSKDFEDVLQLHREVRIY